LSEIAVENLANSEYLYAGRLREPAAWAMKAHAHPHHELVVVIRGRERVVLLGETIIARPGEFLLYPPCAVHEEGAEGDAPLETVFVGFQWTRYREGMPLHKRDDRGRIQELAAWLEAEHEAYFPGAAAFRQALLDALLAEYLRLAAHQEHQTVQKVRAFIRGRIDCPLTLENLAQCAGMSKYHLIRTYRALTGLTPMEDARRIRVEAARRLLLTTDLPLKTIAPRVGFANEYHLSRLLRSRLGVGARELRQISRGQSR